MKDSISNVKIDFKEYLLASMELHEEKMAEEENERELFVSEYPLDRIRNMGVDEYCLGTEFYKDSLCYAIEFGRYKGTGFGIGGGTSKKYGVFYNRDEHSYRLRANRIENIQTFWPQFREQLYRFLVAAENSEEAPPFEDYPLLQGMGMVLTKLLCLYYPDKYVSVGSMTVLRKLLEHFGYEFSPEMAAQQLNRTYDARLRKDFPELETASGLVIGSLSWDYIDGESKALNKKESREKAASKKTKAAKQEASASEVFELTITADAIVSTDNRFTVDNLGMGNNYKPVDAVFIRSDGTTVTRQYSKGERKNSNQTLPRLAIQVFEEQIENLPRKEKEAFPVCRYTPESSLAIGIYSSIEEFKEHYNTIEFLTYRSESGNMYVIYAWNLFSTLVFVQECLKRFGNEGDRFVLKYKDKIQENTNTEDPESPEATEGYRNPYSSMLVESGNIVFRGAPGTGKTFLARKIATDIVSNGHRENYDELTEEQKEQIEFVQFHPSYDYADFVEGLRPIVNKAGTMAFKLQDGIFKEFADKARENLKEAKANGQREELKKYVFIIDEINRGEISKIFGELFFSIDPGYRGEKGAISTQYANLHKNRNEKFYIPENLYIIGTMNDIDRSVDSFDFAMRRRFRFIELKAEDSVEMLSELGDDKIIEDTIARMKALNKAIADVDELNENYQVGAAYFLKRRTLDLEQLWTDHLQPLLQEYVRGLYNEKDILKVFKEAYDDPAATERMTNATDNG